MMGGLPVLTLVRFSFLAHSVKDKPTGLRHSSDEGQHVQCSVEARTTLRVTIVVPWLPPGYSVFRPRVIGGSGSPL